MPVTQIIKRDGRLVPFERERIANAIARAAKEIGLADGALAEELSEQIAGRLERQFPVQPPSVEDIQDVVEKVLVESSQAELAKAYILYRQKRAEIRAAKRFLGVKDDLKLTVNAVRVLNRRYLIKDETGEVIETPRELFQRIARVIAAPDASHDPEANVDTTAALFYEQLVTLKFMPNSPTLMNAGTDIGQLSACFVLPVEDSIEGIFDTLKHMAIIHKSGGGTGFSFSRLRPAGDIVRTTTGIASGPISFMRIYDTATDVIKQGGRRRGANMGILRVDHPDVLDFIAAKERADVLPNFNISVAVTEDFMRAVAEDRPHQLVNPRTGRPVRTLKARDVFDLITTMAWRTGDPGLVFIDRINAKHSLREVGEIESTNPCGEQPLLPQESCNLGSINLTKFVKDGQIDWDDLRRTVHISVHFLDNVIDASMFPLPQIAEVTRANRKIGLGVMGFAELLILLSISYDSNEALEIGEKIMAFIAEEAKNKSMEMARVRGAFPNFDKSTWRHEVDAIRNATLTTVAPTGTISIIAGCSSGIEPLFAVTYMREVMEGTRLLEVNPIFERIARERGFYSEDLMRRVAQVGSIQGVTDVPEDVRRLFPTTFDVPGDHHVRVQAAFQKYVDNAVSKTVNLPEDAPLEEVRRIYLLAHELGCKGITVYRYGSKPTQVLYLEDRRPADKLVRVDTEYAGGCPYGECAF